MVGVASVDAALERLMQAVLQPSPGSTDTFFQLDRPLGSFGARITLAARLGLIDPHVEQALQTLRRVRNAFAHSTTTVTLTDPSHSDRLAQAYAEARSNALWQPLERILQEKVGGDGFPLEPALRDYILLITILDRQWGEGMAPRAGAHPPHPSASPQDASRIGPGASRGASFAAAALGFSSAPRPIGPGQAGARQ